MKKIIHVPISEARLFGHMETPLVTKDTKPFIVRNGVPLHWDKAYTLVKK